MDYEVNWICFNAKHELVAEVKRPDGTGHAIVRLKLNDNQPLPLIRSIAENYQVP